MAIPSPTKIEAITNIRVGKPIYAKDFFITISPSNDDTIINENVATFQTIAINRNQTWLPVSYGKTGIVASRQMCLDGLHHFFPDQEFIKALWLDSDMRIISTSECLKAITDADDMNMTIVANYKRGGAPIYDNTLYFRKVVEGDKLVNITQEYRDKYPKPQEGERWEIPLTNKELRDLPNYAVVDYAGLGFVYGWVPLKYKFHTDNVGEDFYYFIDNEIKIRYAKNVKFAHRQTQWLTEHPLDVEIEELVESWKAKQTMPSTG